MSKKYYITFLCQDYYFRNSYETESVIANSPLEAVKEARKALTYKGFIVGMNTAIEFDKEKT